MIKFLMRKTIYKGVDLETQDMLLQLVSRQHIIQFLCFLFWAVIFIFPCIPVLIIDLCEDVEFALSTQIAVYVCLSIYYIGFILSLKFFGESMFICSHLIAQKVYFGVCTTKGKALSKKDFETIKCNNDKLYDFISTQQCRGYCYSICFEMLKALKKGCIEFVAVKKFSSDKDDDNDGKNFTMHVLYINNGWAFDTFSSRQYPIDELHKIYKAKTYQTFNFDEIKDKSYEDFKAEREPGLAEWCNINDCSQFWKGKIA